MPWAVLWPTYEAMPSSRKCRSKASYIMGIPFTISAFLTPVVGGVVDYCGGHAFITTSAAVILFGVHMTIRMSSKIPYVPLVFQGIAYSMYASAL